MKILSSASEQPLNLKGRQLLKMVNDPVRSARAANLLYVADSIPGITRMRKKDTFIYTYKQKVIRDKITLERISRLAIPPAWSNVWICPFDNGHLQATGFDSLNRKQYRYHSLWNEIRNQTKYYKMLDFGKALPAIRSRLKNDLARPGFPPEKILASIISLMEIVPIRVGSNAYEKDYGSYGLTTLKNHHAKINGNVLELSFTGKKGIKHRFSIYSRKLAGIVRKCREIPGKELFQYYDGLGNLKTVDSGMVNDYIRETSAGDFTTKDFRTWSGTLQAFIALKKMGPCSTKTQARQNITEALDTVAKHLGNTRNVCKKYYVHPSILTLYETNRLAGCLCNTGELVSEIHNGLTRDEQELLKILNTTY